MSSSSAMTGSIAEGTHLLKCLLLTAHNWTLWKHRMSNHLRAQQLWDVVDPTTATEKSASTQKSASDTTRETWGAEKAAAAAFAASTDDVLRAAKALDLIESHISEDLLSMLLSMNNPWDVWIFLTQRFEANSFEHLSAIQLQFQSLRLHSGQTIDSYIAGADHLFFWLASVGINLSCLRPINQVLDCLPPSYNQLVATIRTSLTLTQQITLILVHQTLAAEELRQATEWPNNTHNAHTALYMNGTKSQTSNGSYRNQTASEQSRNRQQAQRHYNQSCGPSCKHCYCSTHSSEKC